jgi:hypothetical protein
MKRKAILLSLLLLMLFAPVVLAMNSANFNLDWFTPLSGSGGGRAISTHYAVNFTVGQAVVGKGMSPNYKAGIGYWYGIPASFYIRLPFITK